MIIIYQHTLFHYFLPCLCSLFMFLLFSEAEVLTEAAAVDDSGATGDNNNTHGWLDSSCVMPRINKPCESGW